MMDAVRIERDAAVGKFMSISNKEIITSTAIILTRLYTCCFTTLSLSYLHLLKAANIFANICIAIEIIH